MADPTPIRPVEPAGDPSQEMADLAVHRVREYTETYGRPPQAMALVLLGNVMDCDQYSEVNVWCPTNEKASRLALSSTASALLMKHALNL